ncbi:helix-turn-helix domain-containing protein [Pelosinus propionicus]|uniref:Helix-turn-helix domain-containing protein n=1 Tax=Pelosinus propionicus DSM 13327 TaxID=1123291 RepID=A0A1I4NXY5_9FIRM|nr:helix-turn-helix transcriptional regulator [Pelosinus propionicus]SFM20398.1 Helix-turn-helix domain-containing protein [Pelosinus propionicus DSM 13327]
MLGKRLKELRTAKDLTQQKLANILGIPRGTYAHYEIGKREPDNATLLQFAKFFKVTVDYLLNNDTTGLQSVQPRTEPPSDLIKFLDQSEVLLDGMPLTKEDKSKIKASLDIIFWDSKQKKKQEES